MSTLAEALTAWQRIVGDEHAFDARERIRPYERATFRTDQRILAILQPKTRQEVQRCLEVATKHRIPVYPVSRGRNWGLGSWVPVRDRCVVIDLHRMNRIVAYDEELSYVTVEPGVTFQAVSDFLREKESSRYLSVIGGPPDASLIGNALERGDSVGPYGERLLHMCDMEVILSTGESFRTGFGHFDGARNAPVIRWGVGPYLDGLFSQSNFGIVTQATFWLAARPSHFQTFIFTVESESQLPAVCEGVRHLLADGILPPNSIALWNGWKFAASFQQYPWELTEGRTPLAASGLRRMKIPFKGASWVGVAGLYSPSGAHARADRRAVSRRLKGTVSKLVFLDGRTARLLEILAKPIELFTGTDVRSLVQVLYREPVFMGFPTTRSIESTYWRKRHPIPPDPDPDRDRCGVLWLCPAVPFAWEDVHSSLDIVYDVARKYELEPNVALTFPSERCVYVLPSILFDRENEEEDACALACHDEMLRRHVEAGYLPYRLGIQSMDAMPGSADDYDAVAARIKQTLDPSGVIAPGRYDPRR